ETIGWARSTCRKPLARNEIGPFGQLSSTVDERQRGGRDSKRERRFGGAESFEDVVDIEFELAIMPTGPASNSQSVDVIVMPRHVLEARFIPGLFTLHVRDTSNPLSVEPRVGLAARG